MMPVSVLIVMRQSLLWMMVAMNIPWMDYHILIQNILKIFLQGWLLLLLGIKKVVVFWKNNFRIWFSYILHSKFRRCNDCWNLFGTSRTSHSNSSANIFYSYGKKLAELKTLDKGWNGNYNSIPLPSADYWFKINLDDGRLIKGHFALKRWD